MSESKTVLNGDSPQSTTLRHLLTLPAVQDGVRAFKGHPLGKMSIQLSNSAYQVVASPVFSLLNKPFAYVSPYIQRADELGDQTLSKVEKNYPVVKKSSPEVIQEARDAVYAPIKYVTEVYNGAYKKTGGGHVVASGKAAAKTMVVIYVEGIIFVLREAVALSEQFQINEGLKGLVDQLEATLKREDAAGAANHDRDTEAESQNGAKTSGA
ncbi:hypothetical protein C8A00DRAFT_44118 [Chaetomidium leptoderma]|uniref:Uncharacterized protein n=1 Tax=Chaetomidium leptoderma TaxID=669021 RepID=A0AAN6VJU3_9PEZI|nr:hypothetical protein C8A00DRAFT_44118 [Chaetomidium leptoderma]